MTSQQQLEYAKRQMSPEYGVISRYRDWISWRSKMALQPDLDVPYGCEKMAARKLIWC